MDKRATSAPLQDFYQQEQRKLRNYVNQRVSDDVEADDIIQDVMVGFLNRPDPTLPLDNLAAYIYRSLKNRIIDVYRSNKHEVSLDIPATDRESGDTLKDLLQDMRYESAMQMEKKEIQHKVFEAIDRLNSNEKSVVLATEIDNATFRELSELWDIPMGTLLARKSRALKKLRKTLRNYILED